MQVAVDSPRLGWPTSLGKAEAYGVMAGSSSEVWILEFVLQCNAISLATLSQA